MALGRTTEETNLADAASDTKPALHSDEPSSEQRHDKNIAFDSIDVNHGGMVLNLLIAGERDFAEKE